MIQSGPWFARVFADETSAASLPPAPDLDLEAALSALERDSAQHFTAGPADAQDLRRTEEQLGMPLPAPFRRFLERIGGGLF